MAGNSIGNIFRLTTFGESHGPAIGGIIDGCPAGIELDFDFINNELKRRRPGQSEHTTKRSEKDEVEFLSGILDGKTLGTPISFIIKNNDKRSSDYSDLKNVFRPSHADYTYQMKYGIRDFNGGGRASARETAARVVAGAIAKIILKNYNTSVVGFVSQIGKTVLESDYKKFEIANAEKSPVRCPDAEVSNKMIDEIKIASDEGDSLGGVVTCIVTGAPAGLGEPVFGKLNAALAYAICSIPAVKGFELGSGFAGSALRGSEHNDSFVYKNSRIGTYTNNSGGIQGGISNGEDIVMRVAFKPVASISKEQQTVDETGNSKKIQITGRHDPCVVPRAVPIVEAMAAIVILDNLLLNNCYK